MTTTIKTTLILLISHLAELALTQQTNQTNTSNTTNTTEQTSKYQDTISRNNIYLIAYVAITMVWLIYKNILIFVQDYSKKKGYSELRSEEIELQQS